MIFTPSATGLVYPELNFIVTSVPVPKFKRATPVQQIFDEVSKDIRSMFLESPECLYETLMSPFKK